MRLSEIKQILKQSDQIQFLLPNGEKVPAISMLQRWGELKSILLIAAVRSVENLLSIFSFGMPMTMTIGSIPKNWPIL